MRGCAWSVNIGAAQHDWMAWPVATSATLQAGGGLGLPPCAGGLVSRYGQPQRQRERAAYRSRAKAPTPRYQYPYVVAPNELGGLGDEKLY
jgi:hypothetical protein